MLDATLRQLRQHRVTEVREPVIVMDGYWHFAQIQSIAERGINVLIPPDGTMREGK